MRKQPTCEARARLANGNEADCGALKGHQFPFHISEPEDVYNHREELIAQIFTFWIEGGAMVMLEIPTQVSVPAPHVRRAN